MRVVRVALAVLALALALVAILLASDVGRWRSQLESGDRAAAADPAGTVDWVPSTALPFDPARRLVGLGDDIALRKAIRDYVIAARTGKGFDNGQTRDVRRDEAESALEGVILNGSPAQVAHADVLLGVLAFGTSSAPVGVAQPGARSVDAFSEAARLDPSDTAAKFDLELALRALAPVGTRPGSNASTGGQGHGTKGAGAGLPGSGF